MWQRAILSSALILGWLWFGGAPAATADNRIAVPIADVTVTSTATLIAAREDRTMISCTNTSSSVHVRWGNATVTASTGQQLRAGASIQISNRDDIYMISEGANVTVSCTKEYK